MARQYYEMRTDPKTGKKIKVISSYGDLTDALKSKYGGEYSTTKVRRMSKRERLAAAKGLGWVYSPEASFGTSTKVTEAVQKYQVVREGGKITGKLYTEEQYKAVEPPKPKKPTSKLRKEGFVRESGTWESQLKPSTVKQLKTGQLKVPEGTTISKGILTTPKAAKALAVVQEQKQTEKEFALARKLETVRRKGGSFRPAGTSIITREPISPFTKPTPTKQIVQPSKKPTMFEYDVMKWEQKEAAHKKRMARVETTASLLTLGGGKPLEQRSWFGKYTQNVVGGFMGFAPEIGARSASLISAGGIAIKHRKQIQKGAVVGELGGAFKRVDWGEIYNPLKPSGAATWSFALSGAGLRAIERGRIARAKPETRLAAIETKRVITGKKVLDVSKVKGEVKIGKRTYEIKGRADELWFPEQRDILSRLRTEYKIDVVKQKRGKTIVKDSYTATGIGLGRTRFQKGKSFKVLETETVIDIPSKKKPTVIFSKDIAEVKGKETKFKATMKGKEYSFIAREKKPTTFTLDTMGRFTSKRYMSFEYPKYIVERWRTAAVAKTPEIPKGAKILLDERGIFQERTPSFIKSKRASIGREKTQIKRLVNIEELRPTKARPGELWVSKGSYKTMLGEIAKSYELSRVKTPFIIGTTFKDKQKAITEPRTQETIISREEKQLFIPLEQQKSIPKEISLPTEKSIISPIEKVIQLPIQKQTPIQRGMQIPIQRAAQTPIQRTVIDSMPRTITRQATPSIPFLPPFIIVPVAGKINIKFPKITSGYKKTRSLFEGAYTPSIEANVFNIIGKKPKEEKYRTGLFLRPILKW